MSHRVALVTGASRGIGRAIAIALAQNSFDVVVNYASNRAAAQQVADEITRAGQRPLLVQADVSVAADRQKLVAETLSAFGRIDLLVNNAGIAPAVRADLLEATEESFDRLLNVNLKGPYFLTQHVAREMLRALPTQDSGLSTQHFSPKIINITSVSAYAPSVHRGEYCVAKAGLAMMTQLFAARLAPHDVNVYEIRPGVIDTDMTGGVREKYDKLIHDEDLTPLKRWGRPEDVARAVVAIATDLLPFSTGEVINVDGGFHMRRL